MAEKYIQYSELLTPLLKTNEVTRNILGVWFGLWYMNLLYLLINYTLVQFIVYDEFFQLSCNKDIDVINQIIFYFTKIRFNVARSL